MSLDYHVLLSNDSPISTTSLNYLEGGSFNLVGMFSYYVQDIDTTMFVEDSFC